MPAAATVVVPILERFQFLFTFKHTNIGPLGGTVIFAHDRPNNNRPVVLKLAPDAVLKDRLSVEHRHLKFLCSTENNPLWSDFAALPHAGLPIILDQTLDNNEKLQYIVFNPAGMSLEQLHRDGFQFSLNIICKIAIALLQTIKFCHKSGILHRDIHPGNVIVGGKEGLAKGKSKDPYRITLIDFAISKDIRGVELRRMVYSAQTHRNSYKSYCSANHERRSFCKKDDVEMVALMLLVLPWLTLPWNQSRTMKTSHRMQRLEFMERHRFPQDQLPTLNLPSTSPTPAILTSFLEYVQKLEFNEEPDYDQWIKLFEKAA